MAATLNSVDILALRRRHVNPNLSISYGDHPLQIVRGQGQLSLLFGR